MINRAVIACGLVIGLVAPAASQQRTDLRSGWAVTPVVRIEGATVVAKRGTAVPTR